MFAVKMAGIDADDWPLNLGGPRHGRAAQPVEKFLTMDEGLAGGPQAAGHPTPAKSFHGERDLGRGPQDDQQGLAGGPQAFGHPTPASIIDDRNLGHGPQDEHGPAAGPSSLDQAASDIGGSDGRVREEKSFSINQPKPFSAEQSRLVRVEKVFQLNSRRSQRTLSSGNLFWGRN